jgi:hypothetical protein
MNTCSKFSQWDCRCYLPWLPWFCLGGGILCDDVMAQPDVGPRQISSTSDKSEVTGAVRKGQGSISTECGSILLAVHEVLN